MFRRQYKCGHSYFILQWWSLIKTDKKVKNVSLALGVHSIFMEIIFLHTSGILKYVFKMPDQCTHIDEVYPKKDQRCSLLVTVCILELIPLQLESGTFRVARE